MKKMELVAPMTLEEITITNQTMTITVTEEVVKEPQMHHTIRGTTNKTIKVVQTIHHTGVRTNTITKINSTILTTKTTLMCHLYQCLTRMP